MADGPGKYDAETTVFREATEALAVVTVVIGGRKGNGFEMQVLALNTPEETAAILLELAEHFRRIAGTCETDAARIAAGDIEADYE